MVTFLPYHAAMVTLLPCAYIPIYIRNDRRTTYMHTLGLKQIYRIFGIRLLIFIFTYLLSR